MLSSSHDTVNHNARAFERLLGHRFIHCTSQLDDMDDNYIISGYQEEPDSDICSNLTSKLRNTHPGRINREV